MKKPLLALIIVAGASGCASAPQYQSSRDPDPWDRTIQIRKQKLAEAQAVANASCKDAREYSNMAVEAGAFWGSVMKDLVSTSHADCIRAEKVLEEEKALYAQMVRTLERIAYPPRINVYHY